MFARLRPSKVFQATSRQIWWTARTVASTARNAVEPNGVTSSCDNLLSFTHSPALSSMGTAGVDRSRIIHRGLRTSARSCHGGIVEHDELVKLIEGKDAGASADAVDFSLIVRCWSAHRLAPAAARCLTPVPVVRCIASVEVLRRVGYW